MFMQQQPTLTPEQKQALRQNTVAAVQNFVLVALVLRAAPFAIEQINKLL
ncbi:hypothetical protein BC940DRAFT_334653 [Gongronella butleri]|nr:hypothetical protein BC940DRAFT_334653 [Gongronella butleri]